MEVLPRDGWETIVIAATGPSFDVEQAALISRRRLRGDIRVIAINNNYQRQTDADLLYACDLKWWHLHIEQVRATFAGEKWTQDPRAAADYGLNFVASKLTLPGLTRNRALLHGGGNSGYQAINLAYLFGAKRIVLVGFDCQLGPGAEQHWFGSYPKPLSRATPFSLWIERFGPLANDLKAEGVDVVNSSKRTALACFQTVPLEDALA